MVEQQRRITAIHEVVRKHLQSSADMQQIGQIQGGLKMKKFKVGELKYPWTGLFEVTDVAKDRNIARIRGYGGNSCVHASSLKPFIKNAGWQIIVNPK